MRSEDLVAGCLERIEAQRGVNAVVELDADGALRSARAADRLLREGAAGAGPLCGLPATVKRTFEVRGYRHVEQDVAPSAPFGRPAAQDAAVVADLRAAGEIVLGRTNAPPRAADIDTWHPLFGRTAHPFDSALSPGGSSGGSAAAVAAGHAGFDLASDDAGSARIPAQLCGVYALRPTQGSLSALGHVPGPVTDADPAGMLSASLIARSAQDLAFLWRVLGPGGTAQGALLADAPLAVVLSDRGAAISAQVSAALGTAVERLRSAGLRVIEARLPVDLAENWLLCQQLLYSEGDGGAPDTGAELPEPTVESAPIEVAWWCAGMPQAHRLALKRTRALLRARWQRFFAEYAVLITPVLGVSALEPRDQRVPLLADEVAVDGREVPVFSLSTWCALASVAGLPAVALPLADPAAGNAAAFQVLAGHGRESALLDAVQRLSAVLAGEGEPR